MPLCGSGVLSSMWCGKYKVQYKKWRIKSVNVFVYSFYLCICMHTMLNNIMFIVIGKCIINAT